MTIDRPVEKVLEFIDDARNVAKCSAHIDQVVQDDARAQRVGSSALVILRVLGTRVGEEFTVARFSAPPRNTPHRRYQIWQTFRGPARGVLTWTLEAEVNQTYASVDVAYQLAGGILGRALDALAVEGALKKEVELVLESMKRQLGP